MAKSKGFGFVSYENAEDARQAVNLMNNKVLNNKDGTPGKPLFCARHQKRAERDSELKVHFFLLLFSCTFSDIHACRLQRKANEAQQRKDTQYRGINLFVKNLDDKITDERLREEFSKFGTISSAKVMCPFCSFLSSTSFSTLFSHWSKGTTLVATPADLGLCASRRRRRPPLR